MKTLVSLMAIAVILFPGIVGAQEKVGTVGANFLQIGISPRAVGMGEAFVPLADDVAAAYYNPAGLGLLQERQILLSHVEWPADIQLEYAAVGMPAPSLGGVVALSMTLLHMGEMEVTTPFYPNGTGQMFTARNIAVGISYARFLTDKFSFGITTKYVQLSMHNETATGWGADVGTYYDTGFKSLIIAMSTTNFGPNMKFLTEDFQLPINFSLGFSMNPIHAGPHRLTTAFAGSHPSDNQERYNFGLEYWFDDMLALRAGYKVRFDEEDMSFGAGLRTSLGSTSAQIDYAYVPFQHLEQSHRLSLILAF